MRKSLLCISFILLSACAKTYELHNSFDISKAQIVLEKGDNTIKGEAFMRQRGGGIVTCAGSDVELIPYTEYAGERIRIIYNGLATGFSPWGNKITFIPDIQDYYHYSKTQTCSANGSFTFNNIKDGNYFITSCVQWWAGDHPQGGCLMKNITVKGGETMEVILSN